MNGEVFDIYRLSSHDGPGLRTVIFLKGCPLRCKWCHNPESFKTNKEVWINHLKCIKCGKCILECPTNSLKMVENRIILDRESCINCLKCSEICPPKAITSVSKTYSVEELLKIIKREIPFMEKSGGGVTISGGEPLLQSGFLIELLKNLKSLNLHTAVDTCGFISWDKLNSILPYTDLILYDLKIYNDELHKEYTGVSNKLILENLKKIGKLAEIWIRTPLIPKATSTKENIAHIGQFIKENLIDNISRWELCAFNPLASDKYIKLNMSWDYSNDNLLSLHELNNLKNIAIENIGVSEKVITSGFTSKD